MKHTQSRLGMIAAGCFLPLAAQAAMPDAGPAAVECGNPERSMVRLEKQSNGTYDLLLTARTSPAYRIENYALDRGMTCQFSEQNQAILSCKGKEENRTVALPRSGTTKEKTVQGQLDITEVTTSTKSLNGVESKSHLDIYFSKGEYGIDEMVPTHEVEAEDIDYPQYKRTITMEEQPLAIIAPACRIEP